MATYRVTVGSKDSVNTIFIVEAKTGEEAAYIAGAMISVAGGTDMYLPEEVDLVSNSLLRGMIAGALNGLTATEVTRLS